MTQCKCGSYAINHHLHGRDGSRPDLCDVCYWRDKAMNPTAAALGRLGGKARSAAKTKAARENAKKGGWPKGRPRKPQEASQPSSR